MINGQPIAFEEDRLVTTQNRTQVIMEPIVVAQKAVPRSIERFVKTMQKHGVDSPATAREMLGASEIGIEDVMPWADFEHSPLDSYGRKMVHQGENYELMVMSWVPGDFSAIHDHGATQWGAVLFLGEAEHASFTHEGKLLTTNEREAVFKGDINEVDHSLIHQMGNRNSEPFLSVHLYGCHSNRQDITADARVFNLLERTIQFTDGGVFYCLPESQITGRVVGPMGDDETTLEHHRQMRDRIHRIQQHGCDNIAINAKHDHLRSEITRRENCCSMPVS